MTIESANVSLLGGIFWHRFKTTETTQRRRNFDAAHKPALATEGKILSELRPGINASPRLDILSQPAEGYQKIIYSYNGGKAQYELQQGATSVSVPKVVELGGLQIPATETTINSTGELKSPKRIN